jgi:NADH-quinone oxidoreductase subunit G
VAPFSGNIIELCPVGALTSKAYRFRARPWDVEGAGGICMLCPAQCNVDFTVRDEKVTRVISRDPFNEDVEDGWLCDKGRFAYQSIHVDERITAPMVRDGGALRTVSWERALDTAAGLARHKGRVGALVGGQATNEEGFLINRLMREGLESGDLDCRVSGAEDPDLMRSLTAPSLQAAVPDLEFAHTVLVVGCELMDEAPVLDLRIRKGVRRRGVQLAVVSARPSALDADAQVVVRCDPEGEAAFLRRLASELPGEAGSPLAQLLRQGGEDVVIVYGERMDPASLPSLLLIAEVLGLADRDGAGLLEIPAFANGRGLREAGVLPGSGPGYGSLDGSPGRGARAIAEAAAGGEITALHLFETDPLRDQPDAALWRQALDKAALVVAHASVLTEGLREHANVIFPADTYAEKEGTVVHPDGRLQRLRTAIGHPNEVRPGWWVVSEIAKRCGIDLAVLTSSMAFQQLVDAVPFYDGLTLEEIGGRGVRWPAREAASKMPAVGENPPIARVIAQSSSENPHATPDGGAANDDARGATGGASPNGATTLRLGLFRPIWAAPEVEISPILKYTIARQQAELSPEDARRLGVSSGDPVVVAQNGTSITAPAVVRSGVPEGTVFMATGLAADSANSLAQAVVEVRAG